MILPRAAGPCSFSALALGLALSSCSAPQPTVTAVPGCPAFSDLSQGLPATRGWRTNPSLADVNGDGYLDLAATTRKGEGPKVFLFDPARGWTDSSRGIALEGYPCGIGVELVDITADGKLDLLVADHCSGLHLFKGDGQGGWQRLARLGHPLGEGFNDAAAGDLDGDGRIDLVALAAFTTGFSVFMQQPDGSFARRDSDLPRQGAGYQVGLADLDGDARLDIYATLQGFNPNARARGAREAKVWLQRPGGWQAGDGLPETGNFYGIAKGDINKDGLPDLALSSRDDPGGIRIFLGERPGTWRASPAPAPGDAPRRFFLGLALEDLDGDGDLDLVAVEHPRTSITVWTGDGSGGFTECPSGSGRLPASYTPGWGLAVGDINRDGRPDLVAGFGSESGGALRAWAIKAGGP